MVSVSKLGNRTLLYSRGGGSWAIAYLRDTFAFGLQVVFYGDIVGLASLILSNDEYVDIQFLACRDILEFKIRPNDIDTAQGFQHFDSLVQWDHGLVGFVPES